MYIRFTLKLYFMQFTLNYGYKSVLPEESPKFFKQDFRLIFIVCFWLFVLSCQKDNSIHPLVGTWNYSKVNNTGSIQIQMNITDDYLGSWHSISSPTCFKDGEYIAATPISSNCDGIIHFPEEYFMDQTFFFDWRAEVDFLTLYFDDTVNEYSYEINGNLLVLEFTENTLYDESYIGSMVFRKE